MHSGDDLPIEYGEEAIRRLEGQLSRLLGMTAARTRRVAGDALREVGAHKDHFVVLATLAELGPASQADLSGRARVYKSDLVALLNDLEEHGWVRRAPDPADKRRNVITITADGERRLAELDRILTGVNDHIMAPLDRDERARLFDLLRRVNAHLAGGADPV